VTERPSPEFLALEAAVSGRYVLDRELGRGGMGVVFLAREVALERPVAIKLLPPSLAAQPELRARFLQEARTAARLAHPHIVPIHAVEERGDLVYFVMGYVPGRTLAEQVRVEGPLAPGAVSRLVQEVAWALAHAHEAGVVHRDIKPENILIERGTGRALVADFGIARLGDATPPGGAGGRGGPILGTASVVSPEQAAGEPLDGRSDLYSLGATAFYALTGRFPFEGGDARGLVAKHLTLPAPPITSLRAGVPPALAAAIDRCLAKSPDARYPTASALAEAVGAAREGTGVPDVLRRLTREISAFGVDLTGYGTLAGVAVLAQLLSAQHDFFGMGYVVTIVIGLVLLSLTALRGMSLARLLLEAAGEGWNEADLTAAVAREARRLAAEAKVPRPGLLASAGIYLAGVAGLLWFWLGPKVAGQSFMEGPLAWLVELVSYIGPVALGRWFGARLEAPRHGLPGLFSRFVAGVKLRFIWFGPRRRGLDAAAGDRPTEVLLADAAREALRALPDPDRRRLASVERLVGSLEADAGKLRRRLDGLGQAAAKVGDPTAPGRAAVARELDAAQRETAARLGTAVSALENVRLELLRLRAGLVTADSLTESLDALRALEARADLERGGNSGAGIP